MPDLHIIVRRTKDMFGDDKTATLVFASTSMEACDHWLGSRGLRRREGLAPIYSKTGCHPYAEPVADEWQVYGHKDVEIGPMSESGGPQGGSPFSGLVINLGR